MTGDDHDLARRFAELRAQVERDAPEFAGTVAQAHARPRRRLVLTAGAATGLALAAALVVAVALNRDGEPPRRFEVSPRIAETALLTARWTGPTDVLLESSTREWLRSVPQFGLGDASPRSVPGMGDAAPDTHSSRN